jgi:DNA-binding GntR family transcriptional regulator
MVEDMESSFAAQNIREYFPRDMAFHDRIAQMLDNSKLLEIYRRIVNEMHLVRLQSIQRAGGLLVSNLEHRAIVDALETRNQEAAAHAMGLHVERAFQRVAPLLPTQSAANQESKTSTEATSQFALDDTG